MLCKIAFRNVRRSLRDYAVYFFTLVVGVAVFYVFNAIGTQSAYLKVSEGTARLLELVGTTISVISVFVAAILGLLIVYASRFLMKRRNREFALYLLLGMGKGSISVILLIETVLVGLFSLGVGLVVGIALSQLMSAFTASLFEADLTEYAFSVSEAGVLTTVLYFGLMYVAAILVDGFMIGRFRLIDLMQSGKRSERLVVRSPFLSALLFLASCVCLAFAYDQVAYHPKDVDGRYLAILIAIGSVSTFLLFYSASGMLLSLVRSRHGLYFRGLNSFTFRQVGSRIHTMVLSMTVICLLLFVTVCLLSSAFLIRNSMNANMSELCPADFEVTYRETSPDGGATVMTDFVADCAAEGYDVAGNFSEYVHFYSYGDSAFTYGDFFSGNTEALGAAAPRLVLDAREEVVSVSDYNALMRLYGKEGISLSEDEFVLLCDFTSAREIRDMVLLDEPTITLFGQRLRSKYAGCVEGAIDLAAQHINPGVFVVPDRVVKGAAMDTEYFIGNFPGSDRAEKDRQERAVEDKLSELLQKGGETEGGMYLLITSRSEIAEAAVGVGALVTFIGLYLGLVFMISCGAILALKGLSESVDSIPLYEVLRKIGADEGEIARSLFWQTGIFFLMPLLLAAVHAVFGMKYALYLIAMFASDAMFPAVASSCLILLLIYGGYFLLTYFGSRRIIRNTRLSDG